MNAEPKSLYKEPSAHSRLNLSTNSPPIVPAVYNVEMSAATCRALEAHQFNQFMGSHRWMGTDRDRALGARLLQTRLSVSPDPDRICLANGVQSALIMLLSALLPNGGLVIAEELTYPSLRFLSHLLNFEVVGVRMDALGMSPEALEAVCKSKVPKVLFPLATLQNPTTVTMPFNRRREIAEIARRYGVPIVEDDIYSLLPEQAGVPLAALAPELSWYILGMGKSLGAGTKIAYVLAPSAAAAEKCFWPGVRTTFWMAPPLNAVLMSELIDSGGVERVLASVRQETRRRRDIVEDTLAGLNVATGDGGFHTWVTLPEGVSRIALASELDRKGIVISKSDTYATPQIQAPEAIRIGFGNPGSSEMLRSALVEIADTIRLLAAGSDLTAASVEEHSL